MYRVGVLVASDKGSRGARLDTSGDLIVKRMTEAGFNVVEKCIVADEKEAIVNHLIRLCENEGCQVVLTTGGTGFSKRDITPEATREVIEREAPGIAEAMRWVSFQKTPKAMLSRAIAGIRGDSIIINMPGSPKAVDECLDVVLLAIHHGIEILIGATSECANRP
jgi:molybdenum cofactor synthesis domain-containing protein